MAIAILLIFILYKGGKKVCGKKGLLEQSRNSKEKRDAAKFEKHRTRFENAEAANKTETIESKGRVMDGNQGAAQVLHATTLKQLPPFVFDA